MARFRLLVGLVVALAIIVAIPAVALAGSAGDNQYQDPFGNTQPTQTAPQTTTAPPATSTPAPTPSQPVASSSPAADPAAASSNELPRTGLDLRVAGGIGILLLGGGLLLRRRLADG